MYNLCRQNILSMTDKQLKDYVLDCEKSFDLSLENTALEISRRPWIRLCGLAGPSCAGKTTGSFKITVYLESHGINVRTISIDDFFHDASLGPVGEDGKPDYESLDYVNLDLLQTTLCKILKGQKVMLPKFDFANSRRIDNYEEYQPEKNEIIILEGLHALNDIMYQSIPSQEYYRIFINLEGDFLLDGQPLFTNRELRLMRRLIRDRKYRGADAQLTFYLWDNVVKGEIMNIHPFENRADFKLNSMFEYEPCVVKAQVLEVLRDLPQNSIYKPNADILIKKLEKVPQISENLVPINSLLREFIGGLA